MCLGKQTRPEKIYFKSTKFLSLYLSIIMFTSQIHEYLLKTMVYIQIAYRFYLEIALVSSQSNRYSWYHSIYLSICNFRFHHFVCHRRWHYQVNTDSIESVQWADCLDHRSQQMLPMPFSNQSEANWFPIPAIFRQHNVASQNCTVNRSQSAIDMSKHVNTYFAIKSIDVLDMRTLCHVKSTRYGINII